MSRTYLTSVIAGIAGALAIFALLIFDRGAVATAMAEYKLLPQPEKFTELYLENHLQLPKTYQRGKSNAFAFTVHNLEHEPMKYEYVVEAIATESSRLIDRGSFELKHDEYKTISERIASTEAQQRTKINISLENKDQSIHFWIDKSGNQPVD